LETGVELVNFLKKNQVAFFEKRSNKFKFGFYRKKIVKICFRWQKWRFTKLRLANQSRRKSTNYNRHDQPKS
jgi:hypothetical protein